MIGQPTTVGFTDTGTCGHCSAAPWCHTYSAYGALCLACWHWMAYQGPDQAWGEGMGVATPAGWQ